MKRDKFVSLVWIFFASFLLSAQSALAASPEINVGKSNGLAIHGYDPVAYFTQDQPTEGDPEIALEYKNAKWVFASKENRELFQANPEKYAPQYGGHCAYAASKGYIADADPAAWRIVNEKLYLNYSLNIKRRWEGDIGANIVAGDGNWPDLLN